MTISNDSPSKEMTMKDKSPTGADLSEKRIIQNMTLVAVFLIVFGLFSSVGGFLKGNIVSWQHYILLVTPVFVFILGLTSLVLLRRGKALTGSSLVFISNLLLPIVAILLQTGLGWAVFVYALTSSIMLIWQTMPKATRSWTVILTALSLALIVAMERRNSSIRVVAGEELSTFFYGASAVLVAIFLVQAVRQSWGVITHSISNRLTALILVITIPLLIGVTTYISVRAGNEIEAQALRNLEQNNKSLTTNISTWLDLYGRAVQEMAMLPDIKSMYAVRQKPVLLAVARAYPNLFLVHTTDLTGKNVARNDDEEPKEYGDRTWFLGAKAGTLVTYEALISRTTGQPALNIAAPIYDNSGKIVGVASITSELTDISKEVLSAEEGRGITYVVDANNRVVSHPDPSYTEGELRDLSAYPPVVALREGKTGKFTFTDENGVVWVAYVNRLNNNWGIVAQQTEAELLAPVRQFETVSIILILIGSGVMFALAWFAIRRNLQPIGALTSTASAIAAGDLSRIAEVKSQDEIGVLATTFNEMTAKLREFIGTLEARVAERTRNLELAAEVGRTVSQVRALDIMLTDAAELIRKQFDLYYVQVYLTDASRTNLILQSGTGSVGRELLSRGHRLPLDINSINGRAAVEKKSVVISDTATSAAVATSAAARLLLFARTKQPDQIIPDTNSSSIFRPNPLLPDTRSEMAVPLVVGDKVVGVLDLQSSQAGVLSKDNLSAFEALAGQLAIAIQNASLLEEARLARAEVEAQARRLTRASWSEYLDAIHKPEQTGFVFEGNQVAPLTQEQPERGGALTAPITVTGEALGKLVVEMEGKPPIARVDELIDTVARQMAQQIENLRLLDSAERFRHEAEQASRRLTHEGWQEYLETKSADSLGYIYDLKEVRPYSQDEIQQIEESALSLPLKVRDEAVGKVVVKGVQDAESADLVNAVAERLSQHIEGLRLSMQTEQSLAATKRQAQREQALRQITSAVRGSNDPAVILRTAARELGNILGRETVVKLTTGDQTQTSQTDRSTEAAGVAAANNGNEPISPADQS
ncbi:MAG: GAF domain-containing protein [Chloroflexi bacterium]|nr:GAF domain-containing protein [Chloroflexota bacterium]